MDQGRKPQNAAGNWLEKRLATLDVLYRRFGREGLEDQPLSDVGLLLSSKELQLRDAAHGRDLDEAQQAAKARAGAGDQGFGGLPEGVACRPQPCRASSFRQAERPQQQDQQRPFKPKDRGHGMER